MLVTNFFSKNLATLLVLTLAGSLKSVLTSWCLPFGLGSASPYDCPLEEVKIETVWSQDLGLFGPKI